MCVWLLYLQVRERMRRASAADADQWVPLPLAFKVGAPSAMPAWISPHQPRLDWMLWRAANGLPDPDDSSWMMSLLWAVSRHSSARDCDVLYLTDFRNFLFSPFYAHFHGFAPRRLVRRPLYVRADSVEYRFSARRGGMWWSRSHSTQFVPTVQVRRTPADKLRSSERDMPVEALLKRKGFFDTPRYHKTGSQTYVAQALSALRRWYLMRFHLPTGPVSFVWVVLLAALAIRTLNHHYVQTRPPAIFV